MVAEAAVVGVADELTGQAVNAFVSLKSGNETNDQVRKDLVMQVRKSIGPFAAPKAVYVVEDLPKTRSGKIMRRILRKVLSGEEDSLGDTSTVCVFSIWILNLSGIDQALTCWTAVGPECCGEDHRDRPRCPQVNWNCKNNKGMEGGRYIHVSVYNKARADDHEPGRESLETAHLRGLW